ncbi:lipase member H isoform X2 [Ictalurus punctatus]|uniref:Lipase member H isoform X2 n=1 Tax=Ictalurus punctatus TaxID=7998 RepID=A0A9F7TFA4_ICTPU|nr:lipase member H isoform X2 [Ictalurus punctatus]
MLCLRQIQLIAVSSFSTFCPVTMALWWFLVLVGFFLLGRGEGKECDNFSDVDFHEAFIGTNLYVRLLLYTRANLDCGLELPHHNFTKVPLFHVTRPTTFVIHGYRPTGAPPIWINHITRLLAEQADMNVLVVDWNRGAANLNYFTAVANTRRTATNITAFIRRMTDEGACLDSIHLIGVSLGAHVAGFIGAMLGGQVGRITGLDPAGPMFAGVPPEERLDPTDAQFVDVLHTDMNSFGLQGANGHIDFYANGGLDQPGCPKTIFSGKSYFVCDHQRSVFLYLCSLNRTCRLTAFPCSTYTDFINGQCSRCEAFKPASCPVLGYDLSQWRDKLLKLGQTKVYFSTTAEPPYRKTSYIVDTVTWNQYRRWGLVILRFLNGKNVTETRIDHKPLRFEQHTSMRLLAQFDEDLYPVRKISFRIVTANVIGPQYKIRLLRIMITPLDLPERPPMCRYDLVMEENMDVTFKPLSCDESHL